MLTLERRIGERIVLGDGPDRITLTVVAVGRGKVSLGIEAARHVPVFRQELLGRVAALGAEEGRIEP